MLILKLENDSYKPGMHWCAVGLGGIAILVLDISYRKNQRIYCGFYKSLWINYSIRMLLSFLLI